MPSSKERDAQKAKSHITHATDALLIARLFQCNGPKLVANQDVQRRNSKNDVRNSKNDVTVHFL